MDTFQKHNVEQKKQVVEWYVQYNTIYIKFKSMQMVCTYIVKYKNMHGEGHKRGFSLICYPLFLEKKKIWSKGVKILGLTK